MRRSQLILAAAGGLSLLAALPVARAQEAGKPAELTPIANPASGGEKPAEVVAPPAAPPLAREANAPPVAPEATPKPESPTVAPAPAAPGIAPAAPMAPQLTPKPEPKPEITATQPVAPPVIPAKREAAAEPRPSDPTPTAPPKPDVAAPAPAPPKPVVAEPTPTGPQPVTAAPDLPPTAPAFTLDLTEAARKLAPKSAVEKREADAVAAFYTARNNVPLWHVKDGRRPEAEALIAEIGRAGDYGLDPGPLDATALRTAPPPGATPEQLAADEVRISYAVLKYARHARGGRIEPTSLTKSLDRQVRLYEPASILGQIALAKAPASYLQQLHPQHPPFERLRQRYLSLRKSGSPIAAAPVNVPDGPRLQPGASHPHVALVRARLGLAAPKEPSGNAAADSVFDPALVQAVKDFQIARGLKPADGTIGNGTRHALNAVAQGSPRKVLANMEQWRWMPEDLGTFYVWVNIPEYTLRVVSNGQVIHTEKVIIGKTDTQTPVFSDEMEQVIFHPFWGVPDGIKSNEIQPALSRGAFGVLQKHNLRIAAGGRDVDPATIDWKTADLRRFHVYQPPGNDNVLGVVKFRFPNKHDVYMHDTPTKGLFNTAVRTYSHGCMRVQNPVRLAEILLAEDKRMASDRVRQLAAVGAPANNQINLTRRIPVHITYFTALVEEDGKARYFPDIYGHENRINLALEGKAHLIPKEDPKAPPVRAEPVATLKETQKGPRDWVRNVFINN